MKNNFKQSIWHGLKALVFVLLTTFGASSVFAQTITINDNSIAPYYTYGDFEVDYTAAGYPTGTTFYLVVDTNGNGYYDAEDDSEDYILAQSTTLSDVISGDLPSVSNTYDIYVVAGEDGTLGEVISEESLNGALMTASGSDESNLPYSFDLATTARQISTPIQDLTSDDYYTIVVNLDATNVTGTNPLVFEYSTDAGVTFDALTDQQGDDEFSAISGELIFALSQALNVDDIEFRLSQNNGATLAAATEDWTLNSVNVIEYGGTFVQYNEEYMGSFLVNAPGFTTNSETYDDYIEEDIEVDYEAFGFTTGATFYLYTGDIYDAEDRTIFDTNESVSGILSSTWPLELGNDNIDVYLAGIYGNIDEPMLDFEHEDLTITGSDETNFNYYFGDAGSRSAATDGLDISAEEYVTLEVNVNTSSNLSTDNALLVQYSIDESTWVDMEDGDGLDEISGSVSQTFYYNVPSAAITSSTRFRVVQKSIDQLDNVQYWYLYDMNLVYYIEGEIDYLASPFVNNYSISVSTIEDSDDTDITGGSAYPGDEITVTAIIDGFDIDDYNEKYTVLINNSYLLDNPDVSIDDVADEIIISGTIPAGVEYDNNADIHIKIFDGDDPLVTLNQNVFDDYNIEEDITIEGAEVEEGDTDVDFFMAGDRSLATPGFEINSVDDLTLQFTLSRTNSVRSPSGTEVVLEYSTDAGSTYTEIETYSLNSAGETGETYELDDTVLPSGMASASTIIRFRQASNNGLDLDAWNLSGIILMGGTNIFDPGYFNYDEQDLDVLSPEIALTAIDNANLDLRAGTEFDIEVEFTGEFPAGTTFELLMDTDHEFPISIADLTTDATQTITVPAVVGGTYNVYISASHDEIESNGVDMQVSDILITNITLSSTDAIEDGDDMIIYAGNTVDITYDVEGTLSADAVISIEIYDFDADEYVVVLDGEEESEAVDGTVSVTLPVGLAYDSDNDVDFRLSITNGNLINYVVIDETWNNDEVASDEYFPLDDRMGKYGSGLNYFIYNDEVRSATSIPLDFTGGGRFDIDIQTYWYSYNEDISMEYSIDEGETWVNLATETITGNSTDFFPDFIDIPEAAWTSDVLIRFITNESLTAGLTINNGIYLSGFQVEQGEEVPLVEQEFTLQPDLILEELSVSMSTFEETDFILGEEFVVEYNAEGPFEDDVEFAIVLEQDDEYVILAESDETGAVQVTVNIPSFPFEDTDDPYNLEVIPFIRNGGNDIFRASEETEEITEEADIVSIEGRATSGTGSSGYDDFEFELAGDRSIETRSFDLEDYTSATLDFDFTWNDGDVTTLLTLPALQISSNGTDFVALEIADATYETEGLVYPTGSYSVEIPEAYLTSTTSFKWVQELNLGEGEDVWRIYNIVVSKGETNQLNDAIYTTFNNPQSINVTTPSLDNYTWEPSDLTDAVFNGEDFEYNWNFNEDELDESNFPEGTEYTFTIDVEDPETGKNLIIGTTSALGSNLTASIPSYIENDTYDVMLTAMLTVDEEVYYIFEEEEVASLDVFIKAVEVEYLGEDNAVIYAGSTVEFGVLIENDESTTSDFSTFTSNLIVSYSGDDWLLATQTGIDDISVDLPPFIQGNTEFRVELSEDGAIGEVGAILDESSIGTLEDNEENFISGDVDEYDDITFENSTGRGLITTRDFEVGELDNTALFEFDVTFDELAEDITSDQFIVFEYSTDGGSTYTELATFPDEDEEEDTLDEETVSYAVTDDMKNNVTRFRWRQEEIVSDFLIEEIGFTFDESLPFDYISTTIDINEQALLITAIDVEEACTGDEVTLDYEVRGRFGVDNIVTVNYDGDIAGDSDIDGYEFNLVEGTGSVAFALPSDLLDEGDNNDYLKFDLYADDDTNDDYNFTVSGPSSELTVEYVAPVNSSSSFSISSAAALACEDEDVTVSISSPIDYFIYELQNEADGTVLGSLTYDPEVGETEINLGQLTEGVTIQLMVTSVSSLGTECNSLVSSVTVDFEINESFVLHAYDSDLGGTYEPVEAGDSKTICEDASSNVTLRAYRPELSGLSYDIEWFKDDLSSPIDAVTYYQLSGNELSEPGSYFARVTDGSCTYITESFTIENSELPEVPEITVTGDLGICDGDAEVTLEATAGYTYYNWSNGETTQAITVDEEGDYYVEVSNVPFTVSGCSSTSETVELETTYSQEFTLYSSTQGSFLLGGETINDCDQTRIYFYDEDYSSTQTANGGVYTIFKDGVEFSTTSSNNVYLDESGAYNVEWTNDALNGVCTTSSVTFNVVINEDIEEAPVVTVVSGDLLACDGDIDVVLSGPDGFTYYRWSDGSGAQTLNVTDGGTYTLEVSNIPFDEGCSSPESAPVVVTEAYSPDFFIRTETNTEEDNLVNEGTVLTSCTTERVYFYEGTSYANNGTVVLTKDGVEYASVYNAYYDFTESGVYSAIKVSDDINISCTKMVGNFTVTIEEEVEETPLLTATGDLQFCSGEGEVLLTAPAGFTSYQWYFNGATINSNTEGFDASSNTRTVSQGGVYSVSVSNSQLSGCFSPISNIITVTEKALPSVPSFAQNEATCGDGAVEFVVYSSSTAYNDYRFQLVDRKTGLTSGDPVDANYSQNVYLTSDAISEATEFALLVTYIDGSGCESYNENTFVTGQPDNVNIELVGNTITATVTRYTSGNSYDINWYRNGTLLVNREGNTSISITDAAEYSVVVEFETGCTITSNSIDLVDTAAEPEESESLSVNTTAYPNPTTESLSVEVLGTNFGSYNVIITTMTGQVMISEVLDKQEEEFTQRISVSDLPRGTYTFSIWNGIDVASRTIIKN